jgi:hypothetical protein
MLLGFHRNVDRSPQSPVAAVDDTKKFNSLLAIFKLLDEFLLPEG